MNTQLAKVGSSKLMTMKSAIMKNVNAIKNFGSKNSPEILLGAGLTCIVAGTIWACVATRKLDYILEDAEDRKSEKTVYKFNSLEEDEREDIEEHLLAKNPDKTWVDVEQIGWEALSMKERAMFNASVVGEIAMNYAPAVMLMVAGTGMIIGSRNILTKRNAALTAAYTGLNEAYTKYRTRVIDKYGEEVDYELRNGVKKEAVEEDVTDPKTGKTSKSTNYKDIVTDPSLYSRWFDETNPNWVRSPNMNYYFLQCQQNMLNDKLVMRASESPKGIGHMFLNEVYQALGMQHTGYGALVGWLYNPEDPEMRTFIDFGMHEAHNEEKRAFVNGWEPNILLDFNVNGIIYDKI